MTASEFITAVEAMTGFLPDLMERLTDLAPTLSEDQRERAILDLEPLNAELLGLYERQEEILTEAEEKFETFRKQELPKITGMIEASEHAEADTIFDSALQGV